MAMIRRRWSRRSFLAGALGAAACSYGYMRWLEPKWLAARVVNVPLSRTSTTPLRVLHLSDFHASEEVSLEFISHAVAAGLRLQPDLICVTGDFITWRYDAFGRYAEILKPLADAAPAYAVLGNHDGGRWVGTAGYPDTAEVRELLSSARLKLLHNQSVALRVNGRPILLAGVGDLWADELNAAAAFAPASVSSSAEPVTRLLLSHNPDSKEELGRFEWDLMLSGHTHGGQCDLVFFGTPFAPVQDRRYVRGLRRWRDRWIHVTAGVGNLHGMRFNCRPEVNLLVV